MRLLPSLVYDIWPKPVEVTLEPTLSAGSSDVDIHVWSVQIKAADEVVLAYNALLSPDERARAARFRFPRDARTFILARGVLRILLSRYLNIHPAKVEFNYGGAGKPNIAGPPFLQFNTSHSDELAIIAIADSCLVGVDVERIRAMEQFEDIARRYFCEEEKQDLAALTPFERHRAFFLCWTRKEAWIKATGRGLSVPLNGFCVSADPARPARFLRLPPSETGRWTLVNLLVHPEYAAALAHEGGPRDLRMSKILSPLEFLQERNHDASLASVQNQSFKADG